MTEEQKIAGVLLAGGLARRMGGGDKCLRPLAGKSILGHVLARARPQVGPLLLNVNGDAARFAEFALPMAADVVSGHAGPLAGILTGMEWAAENAPECEWLASFATDAPFLPGDMVARLMAAVLAEGTEMARAASKGRAHPVFALWPVALAGALRQALVEEEIHKVDAWTARYKLATVDFSAAPHDPFFNANRPEDFAEAERMLSEMQS
ncbi:MAG: molybdenum cofactor guanylyltransferase MobA [Alphaproteobacteria bacterium]|nr:molybdenum cofactor guanylyltransferase MobA [Alphaproteobacteria bacterium]